MLAIIFILLSISRKCFSGHIIGYDFRTEFQNANFVEKLILQFSLENRISSNDFLKFVAPIGLGTVTATIEEGNTKTTMTVIQTDLIIYMTGKEFRSNTIYKLTLAISLSPTIAGIQGLVSLRTQSTNEPNPIIYDRNDAIGTWIVGPTPSQSSLVVGRFTTDKATENVALNPNLQYTIHTIITFGQDSLGFEGSTGGSKLLGRISNQDFSIIYCSFVSYICSPSESNCVNIIVPASSTCTPSSEGFVAEISSEVRKGQNVRLEFRIVNPAVKGSAIMDIFHVSKNNSYLFEAQTGNPFSSVTGIDVIIKGTKFLWGIPLGNSYPCPIGIYQPISKSSSSTPVVNNMFVEFTTGASLINVEIGIKMMIGKKTRIEAILEGSIYHENLTPVPNGAIICMANFPQTDLDMGILCRGINTLSVGTIYRLGARFYGTTYNAATSGEDFNDGTGYPSIQIFTIKNGVAVDISTRTRETGYVFQKNYNLIPTKLKNIGALADSEGRKVFGTNWIYTYRQQNLDDRPMTTAKLSDVILLLCIKDNSGSLEFYENSDDRNCSSLYRYGVYKESDSVLKNNRLLMFLNPSEFSATNSWDATVFPSGELLEKTHVLHKFMLHKDYIAPNIKYFGLNVIGGLFSNLASAGSTTTDTCGNLNSNTRYCFPLLNTASSLFNNGSETINTPNVYLVNKYNNTAFSDFAVITISCVIKTDGDAGCVFKDSSRSDDSTLFPGFEFPTTTSEVVDKISISSLYPDSQVRDIVYCNYLIPYDKVTKEKIETITTNQAINGILLKLQGVLNFFHIDSNNEAQGLKSEMYFINGACVYDTTTSKYSANDGNHIPLLIRVSYTLKGTESNAIAIFFNSKDSLASEPYSATNSGIFSGAERGTKAQDLELTDFDSEFYTLKTSNLAGSLTRPLVRGYGIAGNINTQMANSFTWNYSPYLLINEGNLENDFYVEIRMPSVIDTKEKCKSFFTMENAVIGLLSQREQGNFYNVNSAHVIYSTLKYKTSGYFSSKNALNLGLMHSEIKIMEGPSFIWNKYHLFNLNSCQKYQSMYPIISDYSIGATKELNVSYETSANANCKIVKRINEGFPGSALTFSYVTSIAAPNMFFSSVRTNLTSLADTTKCVTLNSNSPSQLFQGKKALLNTLICPFRGGTDIDLSVEKISPLVLGLTSVIPYFWGKYTRLNPKSILAHLFTAGWSLNGNAVFAVGQKYKTNEPLSALGSDSSCIASVYSFIYLKTDSQKLTWNLINKRGDMLFPFLLPYDGGDITNEQQAIVIEDEIGLSIANDLSTHDCFIDNPGITCGVEKPVSSPLLVYKAWGSSTTSQSVVFRNFPLMISLFASYGGETELPNEKHKVKVYLFKGDSSINGGESEMIISDCGSEGSDFKTQSARSATFPITNLNFNPTIGVKSIISFSFTFSVGIGYWRSSKPAGIVKTVISLGSLFSNADSENRACAVYEASGEISTMFKTLEINGAQNVLRFKEYKDYPGTFIYKCYGGSSPSSHIENVTVAAETVKGVVMLASKNVTELTQLISVPNSPSGLLKIYFNSPFAGSVWNFTVVFSNDITEGVSNIYVVFPTVFSPKLANLKNPSCFISTIFSACEFIDDWMLAIQASRSYSRGGQYNIMIDGITVPPALDRLTNVYVQLDNNKNYADGILEEIRVTIPPIEPLPERANYITLLNYSLTSREIRGKATHTLIFSLQPLTMLDNNYLFIQFSDEYAESLSTQKGFSKCLITNLETGSSSNYVKDCQKFGNLIVNITLLLDTANSNKVQIYKLVIGEIRNPNFPVLVTKLPVLFTSSGTELKGLGTMSSSSNSNVSSIEFVNPSNLLILSLYTTNGVMIRVLKAYRGYFGSKVVVKYPTNEKSTGIIFRPTGPDASKFVIWQEKNGKNQQVTISSSLETTEFRITSINSQDSGIAFLHWEKVSGDSRATNLPLLMVLTEPLRCKIQPFFPMNKIPLSSDGESVSVPVVFDFSNCMPVESLIVSGIFTVNPDTSFYFKRSNQTLNNTYNSLNQRLYFFIYSKPNMTTDVVGEANFTISGENQENFEVSPSKITINGFMATVRPIEVVDPVVQISPGEVSIRFDCKSTGYVLFVFGIGISTMTKEQIEEETIRKGVEITELNTASANLSRVGFILQSDLAITLIRTYKEMKSGASYSLNGFCILQFNNTVVPFSSNWTQTDLQPKSAKILFVFNREPSNIEALAFLNRICDFTTVPGGVVNDMRGLTCNSTISRRILEPSRYLQTSINFTYIVFFRVNKLASVSSPYADKIALITGKTISDLKVTNFPLTQYGVSTSQEFVYSPAKPVIYANETGIVNGSITINASTFSLRVNSPSYLFLGLAKDNETTPTLTQLSYGVDGSGRILNFTHLFKFLEGNVTFQTTFSPLIFDTGYKVFYALSSQNLGESDTISTEVYVEVFKTKRISDAIRNAIVISFMLLAILS